MEYIVTSEEMKTYDNNTIMYYKVPSLVLMERAAVCTCELIEERTEIKKILVVCGSGNNGGDGLAIARILFTKGYEVAVLFVGNLDKMPEETKVQYESVKAYKIRMEHAKEETKLLDETYDCIVDAIFGISLNRAVTGMYADIIERLNKMQAFKVSADIPSGLHADTGSVLGVAFKADATAAFAFKKAGHLLGDAKNYCGKITCFDIGISKESFLSKKPKGFSYTKEDLALIPKRNAISHKGSFGKLLVIAGSKEIGGAAILCALAAYRSGCGYVRVLTEEANRECLLNALPEAVISTYKEEALEIEEVKKACDFASVIVIGPGIDQSETAKTILRYVLEKEQKPCVIDADAINLISMNLELRNLLKKRNPSSPVIMTPHLLELKRFLTIEDSLNDLEHVTKERTTKSPLEMTQIKENLLSLGLETAKEYHSIFVCKDATTAVFDENSYYINQSGNDALATAGSGDVLAGIIGSMLAKGMDAMEAACISVYMHGACADLFVEENGKSYMKAGDLIPQLRFLLE